MKIGRMFIGGLAGLALFSGCASENANQISARYGRVYGERGQEVRPDYAAMRFDIDNDNKIDAVVFADFSGTSSKEGVEYFKELKGARFIDDVREGRLYVRLICTEEAYSEIVNNQGANTFFKKIIPSNYLKHPEIVTGRAARDLREGSLNRFMRGK